VLRSSLESMINSTLPNALTVYRTERLERSYEICKNSISRASTFLNKLVDEVNGGVLKASESIKCNSNGKNFLSTCKYMKNIYTEQHGKKEGLSLLVINHFPSLVDSISKSFIESQLLQAKLPLNLDNQISEVVISKVRSFFVAEVYLDEEKTSSFIELCQNAIGMFTREVAERVLRLYEGLVHELFIMLDRVPSSRAEELFLRKYFFYAFLDIMEDKYKYHTGQLVCSLIPPTTLPKGELFEGELAGIVIGGWTRRYFQSKNVTVDPVFGVDGMLLHPGKLLVAQALQNAKRAASAISEEKIIKATIDHQKNMLGLGCKRTEEQKGYLPAVCQKLEELVKNYYPYYLEETVPIWRLPSGSACFEMNKGGGGSLGVLRRKYASLETIAHAGSIKVITEDMAEFGVEPEPVFSFGCNIHEVRQLMLDQVWNYSTLECQFHRVLEPFKMRGITAGNAEIYHLGRLLQPILHRYIRDEYGPFRFIGKTHNVEDMRSVYLGSLIYDESYRLLTDKSLKTFIVAGDYKSATDNMDPELPKAFIRAMGKYTNLKPVWIRVLELTLGPHIIHYGSLPLLAKNKKFAHEGLVRPEYLKYEEEWQECLTSNWGQLMGSPTSFPVLCLVNAAMFWASVEIFEKRKLSWGEVVRQYRPLFNGDDISFLSNIEHYRIWEDVCTGCGLALSPGKNYITDKFININSTCFLAGYEKVSSHCKRMTKVEQAFIPNAGLLKGQAKVLLDTRSDSNSKILKESLAPTCDQLTECLKNATQEQAERCVSVFFHELGPKLKKSKRSWILPKFLGGLGLPFGGANEAQLSVAASLVEDYKDIGDAKFSALFTRQANDYWSQILDQLKRNSTGLQERRTKVLFPEDTDYTDEILYEAPSLTTMFITHIDATHAKNDFPEGLVQYKTPDPEEPYVKYRNSIKKRKCPWDTKSTHDDVISRLCQTRLSRSGLTRECYLDVSRPDTSFEMPEPSNLWETRDPGLRDSDIWYEYSQSGYSPLFTFF